MSSKNPYNDKSLAIAGTAPTGRITVLSVRELQVAELVSQGHTNRRIAQLLSLSEKTVETYMGRIFMKLGVASRASVATAVSLAKAQLHRFTA